MSRQRKLRAKKSVKGPKGFKGYSRYPHMQPFGMKSAENAPRAHVAK